MFRGLSFSLPGGQALRIAGANGSGKTSLLRTLCGLLAPARGEVRWQGRPIRELKEDFSRDLVYLGHAPAVKDELTPAENLDVACRLAGLRPSADRISAALERFGVSEEKAARKLSQGQRRRSALARLLLSEAIPLWLLDEPFSALDAAATRLVEDLISAHVLRGSCVVYTTHQEVSFTASIVVEL